MHEEKRGDSAEEKTHARGGEKRREKSKRERNQQKPTDVAKDKLRAKNEKKISEAREGKRNVMNTHCGLECSSSYEFVSICLLPLQKSTVNFEYIHQSDRNCIEFSCSVLIFFPLCPLLPLAF